MSIENEVILLKALPERTTLRKNDLFLVDDSINDTYTVTWEKILKTLIEHHRKSQVGLIIMGFTETSPPGTLLCDGTAVNKTDYPNLYTLLGDKFKQSEDTDNAKFRLPDLKSMFIRGADNGANKLGQKQTDGIRAITFNSSGTRQQGSFCISKADGYDIAGHAEGIFRTTSSNGCYSMAKLKRASDRGYATKVTVDFNFSGSLYNSNNVADEVRPKNMSVNYFIFY